jgi:hypothetical protein
MPLRRGFKARAEELAHEQRLELGLKPSERFEPRTLATHLDIPLIKLSDCWRAASYGSTAVAEAASGLRGVVSAITVYDGYCRAIIYDDANAATRIASDLSHELSHILLEHQPVSLERADCYQDRDQEMEDEATYLGGALLVPRAGVLALMRSGMTEAAAATHFGVSAKLCGWRVRVTGVMRQLRA